MRVTLVTNIVSPYRIPVFGALAQALGDDFEVLCLARGEGNRNWRFDPATLPFRVSVLPGLQFRGRRPDRFIHLNAGLLAAFARRRPDVVVMLGFDQPALLEAFAVAPLFGAKVVLWSGAHAQSVQGTSRLVAQLRRFAVARSDAFLTYGTAAAEYLVAQGARADRIVVGRNAVDVGMFQREPHREQAKALRARLGLEDKVVLLYVGQLIARKGLDTVIEALADVPDVHLVAVGAGPDRAALEALAYRHCPGRAHFTGSIPYAELPAWYAAADIAVMPSRVEVWGLVLNEAMAAGLPVLSSRTAGATRDLVEDGVHGFAIDPDDPQDIARRLSTLADDPELRARAGQAAAERMKQVTTDAYARSLLEAIALAG